MKSLLYDKIVQVSNSLNEDDQEKVLAYAQKMLAAWRIDTAYSGYFIPFEISDDELEKEIKMKRLQSKI